MNQREHHAFYYSFLTVFLVFEGILLYTVSPNRQAQLVLLLLLSLFYIVWGIVHHRYTHNISAKIVIEYILISMLGAAVVLFFMKGQGL